MSALVGLREQSARHCAPPSLPHVTGDAAKPAMRTSPRQKQVRLRPDQVDNLVADFVAGGTYAQLAERFGIGETTVWAHLRRRGVRKNLRRLPGGSNPAGHP